MTGLLRPAAVLLALACAAPFSVATSRAQSPSPQRTFLDRLDMSSPAATLTTLIRTYRRSDYFAVFFLLSPRAKAGFSGTIARYFSLQPLFPKVRGMNLPGAHVGERNGGDESDDALADPAVSFDNIMLAADRAGVLPFTFGPAAQISSIDAGDTTAIAGIATDGEPQRIAVGLRRLTTGDWRIERITWAGSSSVLQPWGVVPHR
ncbi:hypothetical protein [Phreatobacter sp. AB_2022a]|uniref:hypothetical protein n=1 Tax=Phreatobacter sp. AB_2022a TaxID=3003134 RepID=UPI0022870253|nr:hypothetical protein [Phreatobacter sp. AB_2022a]MCZ0736961.1 hypothetical protein [Phreatobacter sp. AB_2022a]